MKQVIIDFGTIHLLDWPLSLRIYGYGLMLVLGFIVGITLAQWRARRMGENYQTIGQIGLLSIVGGIVGARVAYIIQHYEQFAKASNPLAEMANVSSGGLIYYGGLGLATAAVIVYLLIKRVSVRRYLDIMAVSIMIGLAFGRAGCLLNGCCYGADCSDHAAIGMKFPMFSTPLIKLDGRPGPFSAATESPSPVYSHQFDKGEVRPDPRLMYSVLDLAAANSPAVRQESRTHVLLLPRQYHGQLTNDQVEVMLESRDQLRKRFDAAVGSSGLLTKKVWDREIQKPDGLLRGSEVWEEASLVYGRGRDGGLSFDEFWAYQHDRAKRVYEQVKADSDPAVNAADGSAVPEFVRKRMNLYLQASLYDLATKEYSRPVMPSQAIGIANALLIAALLAFFFRLRWREGQVFALMAIMYPITRFFEELIRDDNAHDLLRGVLTHNQYTSLVLLAAGISMWAALRMFPPSAGETWSQQLAKTDSTLCGQRPKNYQSAQNGQRR